MSLSIVKSSEPLNEEEREAVAEARDSLNENIERYLEEWDEFASQRWSETGVADDSPDHVVVVRRALRGGVEDLPEYGALSKVLTSVEQEMIKALLEVREAEENALRAYVMARDRLVKAARSLPGMTKRAHPHVFEDEF